jgi:hypothetical protein
MKTSNLDMSVKGSRLIIWHGRGRRIVREHSLFRFTYHGSSAHAFANVRLIIELDIGAARAVVSSELVGVSRQISYTWHIKRMF